MAPFVLTVLKGVLLALLYFFIWRAVRTIVSDLYAPGGRARRGAPGAAGPARKGQPTKVVVTDERGAKLGTHRLAGTLQIGRASNCEIRLSDTYISQVHARITERSGAWVVEDMGSTNGTFLNQSKVTDPAEIAPGDRIRVGKTLLEVRR